MGNSFRRCLQEREGVSNRGGLCIISVAFSLDREKEFPGGREKIRKKNHLRARGIGGRGVKQKTMGLGNCNIGGGLSWDKRQVQG